MEVYLQDHIRSEKTGKASGVRSKVDKMREWRPRSFGRLNWIKDQKETVEKVWRMKKLRKTKVKMDARHEEKHDGSELRDAEERSK